jgi:hypothetical protein
MKKIIVAILIQIPIVSLAQNNPIFYGGFGDGIANSAYSQVTAQNNFGGTGDGISNGVYTQSSINTVLGGNGDGISNGIYTQSSINTVFGGNGDGLSVGNSIQSSDDGLFIGGNGDGIVTKSYIQQSDDSRFLGGNGDGWANVYFPISPLPLQMLSFTGEEKDGQHILNWKTADEKNMSHFVIEHSANGQSFLELGMRDAKHNSNNQYAFANKKPIIGNNFYRLKLVDKDSKFEYSSVVLLQKLDNGTHVLLYPNPAATSINIEVQANKDMQVYYEVFSTAGKKCAENNWNTSTNNSTSIDISTLASGNYLMKLKLGNQVQVIKFSKQ